jgi:hypothetical protein
MQGVNRDQYEQVLRFKQFVDRVNASSNYRLAIVALAQSFRAFQLRASEAVDKRPSTSQTIDSNAREAQREPTTGKLIPANPCKA